MRLSSRRKRQLSSRIHRRSWNLEPLESRTMMSVSAAAEDQNLVVIPSQVRLQTASGFLTGPQTGTLHDLGLAYLKQNASTLLVRGIDLDHAIITREYQDADTGVMHMYLQQTYHGLPVEKAVANVNVTRDGEIISAGGSFVRNLDSTDVSLPPAPAVSAVDALKQFAAQLGSNDFTNIQQVAPPVGRNQQTVVSWGTQSFKNVTTQLVYVPTSSTTVELGWQFFADVPGKSVYNASISASTGSALRRFDMADHYSASYNVVPAPYGSPDEANPVLLTDPYDPVASPLGWNQVSPTSPVSTIVKGNNVEVFNARQIDPNSFYVFASFVDRTTLDSLFGPFTHASGGVNLSFDFPFSPTTDPINYQDFSQTQLFYFNNFMHDVSYRYGFDEASGNFQETNLTGQGLGGDSVYALSQAGAGLSTGIRDNAFFATFPDGQHSTMAMFVFDTRPGAVRDGSLDALVVFHEFTHGISNRLTGGATLANGLNSFQSRAMGEGWSDFFGLMLTQKSANTFQTATAAGNYLFRLGQNGIPAEFAEATGVRHYPYGFDFKINPLTFRDWGDFTTWNFEAVESHFGGEIWNATLWDMATLLTQKYGFNPDITKGYQGPQSGGNALALQLVMDGLKLQPSEPSFTDARDAILTADRIRTGGGNQALIWSAFARRGLGSDASQLPFGTTTADSISINCGFNFPAATDDSVTVTDGPGTFDPLANDFSLQGLDLNSVHVVSQPRGGIVSLDHRTGKFTYTPGSTIIANDSFTYTWTDGQGTQMNTATVRVRVRQSPVAVNDLISTTTSLITPITILANDRDADNLLSPSGVTIITQPINGTVTVDAQTGAVTYTPQPGVVAQDSFQYTVKDQTGLVSNVATVKISVLPTNDRPIANPDSATAAGYDPVVINVAANDTDSDGIINSGSVLITTNPTLGTAYVDATGKIVYARSAGSIGSGDTLQYTIQDSQASTSLPATVSIQFTAGSHPPVAIDDKVTTGVATAIVISPLGNDSDADSDLSSLQLLGTPGHGTAQLIGNTVRYTPAQGFAGVDSFTYQAVDSLGNHSGTATVFVTVGQAASLSGYVYLDSNGDGVRQTTESGVANTKIRVTRDGSSTFSVSVTTDDAGLYQFSDLPPGTYTVTEVQPAFYVTGLVNVGSGATATANSTGNAFENLVLASGAAATNFNFGEARLRPEFASAFAARRLFLAQPGSFSDTVGVTAAGAWYSFDEGFTGNLVATAQFSSSAGSVVLKLYDQNLKLLATSTGGGDAVQLQYTGTAGKPYFLKVEGTNPTVHLDVQVNGQTNSDWSNLTNPFDTNNDSQVTPLDALLIVNALNLTGGGSLHRELHIATNRLIDVNGDGKLTPLDALLVVNRLNLGTPPQTTSNSLVANSLVVADPNGAAGSSPYSAAVALAAQDLALSQLSSSDLADAYLTGKKKSL